MLLSKKIAGRALVATIALASILAAHSASCVCETEAQYCDSLAYCSGSGEPCAQPGDTDSKSKLLLEEGGGPTCQCPQGMWGNGYATEQFDLHKKAHATGCEKESWMVYFAGRANLGTMNTTAAPGPANQAVGVLTVNDPDLQGAFEAFAVMTSGERTGDWASTMQVPPTVNGPPVASMYFGSETTTDPAIAAFESDSSPQGRDSFILSMAQTSIVRISQTLPNEPRGTGSFSAFMRTRDQALFYIKELQIKVAAKKAAYDASDSANRRDLETECAAGLVLFGGLCFDENSHFQVYAHTAETTSMPVEVKPVGLEIAGISFDHNCATAGCWVFDVYYGVGQDNWNVFYLPRADNAGHATNSYDYDYSAITYPWGNEDLDVEPQFFLGNMTAVDTFLQPNFPCRAYAYDNPASDGKPPPRSLSSCCVKPFLDMYRPVEGFTESMSELPVVNNYTFACNLYSSEPHPFFGSGPPRFLGAAGDDVLQSTESNRDYIYNKSASYIGGPPGTLAGGDATTPPGRKRFAGMENSWVVDLGIMDPITLVHRGKIYVDEIEMRSKAGMLTGEASVEYTVQTFIGLAEFRPTNTFILDVATKQILVKLEKTSYFAATVIAENDYTFLSYVNLRLVDVYNADLELQETGSDLTDRTYRTNATKSAHYLQVTFTLDDPRYQPDSLENPGSPKIIPLHSVRVGQGTFFAEDQMHHACLEWTTPKADNTVFTDATMKSTFDSRILQDCAPKSTMCSNPTNIPDQFVAFNVPLGLDWLPEAASDLSNNVFVDLVITAELRGSDTTVPQNDIAEQFKTQLTASIPVVDGGRNVFCDQITAKTDLADVANVDLILGSASSSTELSRLRIKQRLADSAVNRQNSTRIDTDSIESGLMTLVLYGDVGFFGEERTVSSGYGLQLEDVITIHVMEGPSADPFASSSTAGAVLSLVDEAPEDNYDNGGNLQTTGYNLNGAFKIDIIRSTRTAELHPTQALLDICNWRAVAPRGVAANAFPSTCILRRDINQRVLSSDAFEVKASGDVSGSTGAQTAAEYMQSILGGTTYGANLGTSFAGVILDEYTITEDNNRYNRVFWINPSYEWTPTLTGGRDIFTVSQKIFLFALVRLDECYGCGEGRRMLLQASQDGTTGVNGDIVIFPTSRAKVLQDALSLPAGNVKTLSITKELSDADACLSVADLRDKVWAAAKQDIAAISSSILEVIVSRFDVNKADVVCRRALQTRQPLQTGTASVEMEAMVAFSLEEAVYIDLKALQAMPGYKAVVDTNTDDGFLIVDPLPDGDGGDLAAPEEDSDGGMSAQTEHMITGIVGALFVVVFPVLTFFAVKQYRVSQIQKQRAYRQQNNVGAAASGIKEDLMAELKAEAAAGSNFGQPSASPKATVSADLAGRKNRSTPASSRRVEPPASLSSPSHQSPSARLEFPPPARCQAHVHEVPVIM